MSEYFLKPKYLEGNVKVELDLFNYATKTDLKSDVDKLDIDKLKNVLTNLSNLKSKVDKLDVDKLVPVPVDLSKLSDVVKNDVVKKDVYNAKIKNIEDKIPDITNLATNASLNTKINEVKREVRNIINLPTTNYLTAVENKVLIVSNLIKKTDHTDQLLIIIMTNKLLLLNLISLWQKCLIQD